MYKFLCNISYTCKLSYITITIIDSSYELTVNQYKYIPGGYLHTHLDGRH